MGVDLPVFRRAYGDGFLVYAPGYVARVSRAGLAQVESEVVGKNTVCATPVVAALVHHAQDAVKKWVERVLVPFAPVCLTVYLESRCNLSCIYCYSFPQAGGSLERCLISLEAVQASAELVADNCQARGLPFTLVVHGGGEPTLDQHALASLLEKVDAIASRRSLRLFTYIATNGVMPGETARWLARSFNLIGISCDGPAEIQGAQRPLPNGKTSTPDVERTVDIFHAAGATFIVRTTITPQGIERMVEISDYIIRRLQPKEIHIEPVYRGGRVRKDPFESLPDVALSFVRQYIAIQARARQVGIPMIYSGTRPWEVHGPYCQVFRDVLNLVPGDVGSACFKLSDAQQVEIFQASTGKLVEKRFTLDIDNVQRLRKILVSEPLRCQDCFNRFHCVGSCPDSCPIEPGNSLETRAPSEFRCAVHMGIAAAMIEQAAEKLPAPASDQPVGAPIRAED